MFGETVVKKRIAYFKMIGFKEVNILLHVIK